MVTELVNLHDSILILLISILKTKTNHIKERKILEMYSYFVPSFLCFMIANFIAYYRVKIVNVLHYLIDILQMLLQRIRDIKTWELCNV